MLTELQISPEVLPSTPVRLTYRRIMLTHPPPYATSTMTYFVADAKSRCGVNTIGATPWSISGFITGGKIGMAQLINDFGSKFLLLV